MLAVRASDVSAIKAHCLPRDSSLKHASPWCWFPIATNIGDSKTEFSEWLLLDVTAGPGFNSTSPAKTKEKARKNLKHYCRYHSTCYDNSLQF